MGWVGFIFNTLSMLKNAVLCIAVSLFYVANSQAISVIASADSQQGAENTLDANLYTRWSAQGERQWIRYDLGGLHTLDSVAVSFFRGTQRQSIVDIQISKDAVVWDTLHSGSVGGGASEWVDFDCERIQARYVRIVGFGNSINDWNGINEVKIHRTPAAL